MMDELNIAFNDYIDAYKDLDIAEKRKEMINNIKEMIAMIEQTATDEGIVLNYLRSREILDLDEGRESEDDYLEALLVYVENFKNILGQYLDKRK